MFRVILTLFWCCLAKLYDWLENFAPLFQPIRRKEAYEWLVCMRLTKLVVRKMFYLIVCVCYEWHRNVMTPNWKPLCVVMIKFLLSFWMYSIKSTVWFEGTLSTHLFLNSPTKSCSPMRAMTTRKKRNKTSTSLRSLRDRSNVFTIARRPKRKDHLQKRCSFISQTTVLPVSESLSGLCINFKYNVLKQFSSSFRLLFILPIWFRNVE